MPTPYYNRPRLLSILSRVYDDLCEQHSRCAPRNGIPVGGGDWMDSFFKLEGIRGVMGVLKDGGSLSSALDVGRTVSTIAVKLWNSHREWQVHRWEQTAHDYIERTVERCRKESITKGKDHA